MTIFNVIRKADGAHVYRYSVDGDQPIEWVGMEFATHDHVAEVPEPEPPAPPPEPRRITKLAFRNRFTQQEKIAIEIAALDNPSQSMQARAQAAALRASQQDVAVATFIDLNRPDTRVGVQALEAAGLLAPGRAAVILDTPPSAEEVWNG